jgi:exopolyphosphatase/pppGpp-phosphohydrolase
MKTNIPDDVISNVQKAYNDLLINNEEGTALTLLSITPEFTVIAFRKAKDKPENIWLLDIGSEKTSKEFFSRFPPTTAEVENAIQVVEDEIITLSKVLPADSSLYTMDNGIRNILQQTSSKETGLLLRSDMELVFYRLASIISGRPASLDTLPPDIIFAATLLILREVMFHLKFPEIKIV